MSLPRRRADGSGWVARTARDDLEDDFGTRCVRGGGRRPIDRGANPGQQLLGHERLLDQVDVLRQRVSTASGSRISIVVPGPGLETRLTLPPDWTTKPSTMASPRPVPEPTGSVVKNGSKTCEWSSGGRRRVGFSAPDMTDRETSRSAEDAASEAQ